MSKAQVRAMVLSGDGINCERETAHAFRLAGFEVDVVHLNDLILDYYPIEELSNHYSALALPGGFSFGDDLGSGKVLALKLKYKLKWDLHKFAERGGLVIGICNGFQALIRMEIFGKDISITNNLGGKFINRWIKVQPHSVKCRWLKGVGLMDLPIRHGEGRVVFSPGRRFEVITKMERMGMICLKYEGDPNGSEERIAGLCDASGRIFGLMPHPEAFLRWTAHPEWTSQIARASAPGLGLSIFENAFREATRDNP